MKNKLFFVCANMTSGGAERVISILANHLLSLYDVTIVTWYKPEVFYKLNTAVNVVGFEEEAKSCNQIKKIVWFRNYIKSESPCLIISFMYSLNIITLLSLIGSRQKVIVSERVDPCYAPKSKLLRLARFFLYFRANGIVAQTKEMLEYFPRVIQQRGTCIYNPVKFPSEMIGKALKTTKKTLIISVARLIERKNQKMLIKAYSEIQKLYPKYRLVIYGDGAFRGELEKYIDDLQMNGLVDLPGEEADISEKLSEASIFVLSSDFEGMSNSLIEAMCVGLPCISTKVSGASNLINHSHNGILIDVNDCNQLVVSLQKLIEDSDLRFEMGKEATKLYDELNETKIANQWIEYINRILN